MILYTADLHFGHANVIRFDHRPFNDVDEMDYTLIQLWNGRVQKDDQIYIVGDFCYRNSKPEEWYLRQLKGHKHLIIGNHDHKLLANPKAMSYIESVDHIGYLTDQGCQICMCHYPIAEWDGFYKGHYLIYGHIHNIKNETFDFMKTRENALNAGCMINHFSPVSLQELIRNHKQFIMEN